MKVYSTALTADQVKIDYNAGAALNIGTTAASESAYLTNGPGNSPVAYWNLNENTGTTVNDSSGNGLSGTATSPIWKPCKLGSCIKFNGTAGRKVEVADNPYFTFDGPRTLEFWIKKDYASSTNYRLVHYTNSIPPYGWVFTAYHSTITFLHYAATDQLNLQADGYLVNRWHFFTVTVDGSSNGTLYVDGNPVTTDTYSGLRTSTNVLRIGTDASTFATYNWNGYIDDVKLYNYVRSQAQISYDFNRGSSLWMVEI